MNYIVFFFSSRRRHTRWTGDWSSDVCSSDLWRNVSRREAYLADITYGQNSEFGFDYLRDNMAMDLADTVQRERSEERRVGKECRFWGWAYHTKQDYKMN